MHSADAACDIGKMVSRRIHSALKCTTSPLLFDRKTRNNGNETLLADKSVPTPLQCTQAYSGPSIAAIVSPPIIGREENVIKSKEGEQ